MADSVTTKRALACALQALMEETSFEKISVAHICERCGMHRKSFYYHFRDKFDLMNWIFDMDFIPVISVDLSSSQGRLTFFEQACNCFYENRRFYRKALLVKGQNSFTEHFRECLQPILRKRLEDVMAGDEADDFSVDFYTDACLGAIERWLLDKECMRPEQFLEKMWRLIQTGTRVIG